MLKLILISPEKPFKGYELISGVIWTKSEWYENNSAEKAIKLESKDEVKLLENLSGEEKKTTKAKIEKLDQLLQEIRPSEETTKRVEKLHEVLEKHFLLTYQFYTGSYKGIYYNKRSFWIRINKKKGFSIYFPNVNSNVFLKKLAEKYKIKEKPSVFVSVIEDENSFEKAISLLKEFLSRKNIKNE